MMNMQKSILYVINVTESLTPKFFYENYLKELGEYIRKNREAEKKGLDKKWLFIDLSGCKEIEGSVIPNLLVTGVIIKGNTGKPVLYIPENGDCKIMNYLKEIHFEEINEFLDIFLIKTNGEIRKKSEYKLPDFCTTLYLNRKLSEEQVAEELQKRYLALFTKYLYEFAFEIKNYKTQKVECVNILEIFCKQICYNSIIHGESFCFVTMQVNKSRKKIFISIADCGKGMFEGLEYKIKCEKYKPILLPLNKEELKKYERFEIDSRSIIEGMMYRFKDSIYGLWNVLKSVMDVRGIVRLHSGKARIIISDLDCEKFEKYEKERAVVLLYQKLKAEACINKTPDYSGTHIEIELPLKV